jgi:hypothetical protein
MNISKCGINCCSHKDNYVFFLVCRHIFWLGDLNYRVTLDKEAIKIRSDYNFLYNYDQLYKEKQRMRIFRDYVEGRITFKPTYKYDVGTDIWDSR